MNKMEWVKAIIGTLIFLPIWYAVMVIIMAL
jgi:hypothetical protein